LERLIVEDPDTRSSKEIAKVLDNRVARPEDPTFAEIEIRRRGNQRESRDPARSGQELDRVLLIDRAHDGPVKKYTVGLTPKRKADLSQVRTLLHRLKSFVREAGGIHFQYFTYTLVPFGVAEYARIRLAQYTRGIPAGQRMSRDSSVDQGVRRDQAPVANVASG